jgi:hypothetical protein
MEPFRLARASPNTVPQASNDLTPQGRNHETEHKIMIIKWKRYFATLAIVAGQTWAQAPAVAILDIEAENAVSYIDDLADPAKQVTSPAPVSPNVRNFMKYILMGDIVSVNGKPAKGTFVGSGRLVQLVRSPASGQAISDIALRGGMVDVHLEILQSDLTPIGSIMSSGFTGGAAPPGLSFLTGNPGNLAVTGGTGAFFGARGTLTTPGASNRAASMAEDPANRRANGGTRSHLIAYLIPTVWPDIATTAAGGPAVFHSDFSLVTAAKPARGGELLIVTATGLGPTRAGLVPGTPFPDAPYQQINSPVEVTVNGKPADLLVGIAWPGTTDTYRLDIRVPDDTAPGTATLQVTAAFIPGRAVNIPVQ